MLYCIVLYCVVDLKFEAIRNGVPQPEELTVATESEKVPVRRRLPLDHGRLPHHRLQVLVLALVSNEQTVVWLMI